MTSLINTSIVTCCWAQAMVVLVRTRKLEKKETIPPDLKAYNGCPKV